MQTVDLLDAVKARYSLASDYALAKFLGITKQSISHYRQKRIFLDDKRALKIAEMLDLDPVDVLLSLHAERTKCPAVRKVFLEAARRLHHAAVISIFIGVLASFGGMAAPNHVSASEAVSNIHYAKYRPCPWPHFFALLARFFQFPRLRPVFGSFPNA